MSAALVPPGTAARLHSMPGSGSIPGSWMVGLASSEAQAAHDPLIAHGNVTLMIAPSPGTCWPDARCVELVRSTLAAGGSVGLSFGDLADALTCTRIVAAEAGKATPTDAAVRAAYHGARDVLLGFMRTAGTAWPGAVKEPALRTAEGLALHHLGRVMCASDTLPLLAGGLAELALMDAAAIIAGEAGQ